MQGGPGAMNKRKEGRILHVGSLSDVFGAWENVILFEQFAGSSATHPPELGAE